MLTPSWCIILLLSIPTVVESLDWRVKNESLELAKVALIVVRNMSKYTSTVVICEGHLQSDTAAFHTILANYLVFHLKETIAVQFYIGDFKIQLWNHYIFFVDSVETFRKLRHKFPTTYYERRFYFLIVLTKYTPNFYNVLERIFQICYQFNVINVNVIFDHPERGICMYTYTIFSENSCRVVQPKLLFTFNQDSHQIEDIFPEKLTNFYGCPMRIATRIFPPLMMFDGNMHNPKKVGDWNNLYGIEGMLLKEVADALNFTIEILPIPTERSYITKSKAYGCFAKLLNGKADFVIGSFSASDPNRWMFSSSVIYHSSPYVFIVRSVRGISSFTRLLTPFHFKVWILLAVYLFLGAVTIQILRSARPSIREFVFGERNDAPMVNFIATFLGYPAYRISSRNFARFILLIWLLPTLILRSAYQGSMYDAIRMDKFTRRPTGFNDLIKWNYKILVSADFPQLDIIDKHRAAIIVSGNFLYRYKILEETNRKYVTVTVRDNFVHYMASAVRRGSNLFLINDVIYMYHFSMYFPKHSMYLATFDRKLNALSYSGIAGYISAYYLGQSRLYIDRKSKEQNQPLRVTLVRLRAIYDVHIIILSIAAAVFCLELFSVYSRRLRRIFENIS